jgi:hypothetical protein
MSFYLGISFAGHVGVKVQFNTIFNLFGRKDYLKIFSEVRKK